MTAGVRVLVLFTVWLLANSICLPVRCQTVPNKMEFGGMKLKLTEGARKQIQEDVNRLTSNHAYYSIISDRMSLYFPIIERAFIEHNVPDEIKFLAIQESALISDAVSSSNAVGFWQFKDFTAREVGMTVDRKVDERLNIVSASYGASEYLNSNNFFFNNWIYAIMAYNTGRGGAESYVDKSNFGAKSMTINSHTHWYVKKFLAHLIAFGPATGQPHSENMRLYEEQDTQGKTLSQIAKKHKVDVEELKKYNKWLKQGAIPSDKTYTVLIPGIGSLPKHIAAKNSHAIEPKLYPAEIKPGITHSATIIPLNGIPSIYSGDQEDIYTLSAVAGLSEKKFRKYNDMGASDAIISNAFYYVKRKKKKSRIGFHIVQEGELLWEVAQRYGIQKSKLAKKNRMNITDEVKPGQVLWLKKTRPNNVAIAYYRPKTSLKEEAISHNLDEIAPPATNGIKDLRKVKIHTVAPGESLWKIAQKYQVSIEDLLRWNEVKDPHSLNIGQNIQVKAPIEEMAVNKKIEYHTVEAGDTLYAISKKYNMTIGELKELNNLNGDIITVDQVLKVFERQ